MPYINPLGLIQFSKNFPLVLMIFDEKSFRELEKLVLKNGSYYFPFRFTVQKTLELKLRKLQPKCNNITKLGNKLLTHKKNR
jgi:hypothetical protein